MELILILDSERFNKLLNRVYNTSEYTDNNKLVDETLASKGILVTYHDKQYKKKVQLTVNLNTILDGDEPNRGNADKLIRKLEKRIGNYFNSSYTLDDFNVSEMVITTDIDVGSRKNVSDYIQVLQRVGRVKGFSPARDNPFGDDIGFCLDGNSNDVEFMIYDLEGFLKQQLEDADSGRKQLKAYTKNAVGIIRAEVHLTKPKAISACTNETAASGQIADLSEQSTAIFSKTFLHIVPFGDFYKKDKAVEIIKNEVDDRRLRRRMLHLLELIPEKKSLLLAQKALNHRKVDDVMKMFFQIDLSPVTISKRHDVKHFKNLYSYFENTNPERT